MTDVLTSPLASSSKTHICIVCEASPSKYTCPRCSTRTCSAGCSKKHKESTGCSGERDKVKYVPMKEYTWGTMMNDYTFLEEMSRKVGSWGKDIVKGGFDLSAAGLNKDTLRGMAPGRGRGRGGMAMGRHRRPGAFSKKDYLKLQLEARDIFMELLPQGMERKKLNQSRWNSKTNTAQLTMTFTFHPPAPDPLQSSTLPSSLQPFTIVTHKNDLTSSLLTLARQAVSDVSKSKKKAKETNGPPEWLEHFLTPHPDDPESFQMPQCIMNARADLRSFQQSTNRPKRKEAQPVYYQFDLEQPLVSLLKQTYFVEFPSVEFFQDGTFHGITVDPCNATVHRVEATDQEEDRPRKRRKVTTAAKQAMKGMLGDYGSEEEDDGDRAQETTGLSLLGAYAGSDDEREGEDLDGAGLEEGSKKGEEMDVDDIKLSGENVVDLGFMSDDEEDAEGEAEIDPAVLLELVRQARGGESWIDANGEEDEVDWGGSDEEDKADEDEG